MDILKSKSKEDIKTLFKVSDKIAEENFQRFRSWNTKPETEFSSQALYTFVGEAFNNLDAGSLSYESLNYLQDKLIILSGLYGVLKPNDEVMLYRLDITDPLKVDGCSLYNLWKDKINNFLKKKLERNGDDLIINWASVEYTKNIDWNYIGAKVITPEFRVEKDGKLKNVAIWSKKMRGLLTRKLAENKIQNEKELKNIDLPGFQLEIIDGKFFYIKRE